MRDAAELGKVRCLLDAALRAKTGRAAAMSCTSARRSLSYSLHQAAHRATGRVFRSVSASRAMD